MILVLLAKPSIYVIKVFDNGGIDVTIGYL